MLTYVAPLVAAGKIKCPEDIRQRLETIPTAFAEILRGDNFGKMPVQVSPDPTLGSVENLQTRRMRRQRFWTRRTRRRGEGRRDNGSCRPLWR